MIDDRISQARDELVRTFGIGEPDWDDRFALTLSVEAAREICRGNRARAAKLLRAGAAHLDKLARRDAQPDGRPASPFDFSGGPRFGSGPDFGGRRRR